MTDDELLKLVADECRASVGFDKDAELVAQRERALEYIKGEMSDVPSLPNRSKAVSTDVADAIETLLPALVDIFAGDEDVAAFIPRGQEDEEAAQQETDYVNYVVFTENQGFLILYTMFKDALSVKTGVVKTWWEDGEQKKESFERKSAVALQMATQDGELLDIEPVAPEEQEGQPPQEALYNFTVTRKSRGRVKIEPVPPEDFTVAADTVQLSKATYCAMRSRPRVQDLIAQGIDEDKLSTLTTQGASDDETVSRARDTADENANAIGADGILRRVEVAEHYLRLYEKGECTIWRVLTGNDETVMLEKEKVDFIPFAAVTPYIVTHRFYGNSVADKLMELQKINTALTRMALDSGYFALNQRMEVAEERMSANTIPNLLRNEPGVPVLSRSGDAVRPIQAGQLGFDVFGALEYFQTKSEQRTGIVRASQGLAPDTLHETARGALALLTQSQQRVRLIARTFAETGVKDLFLNVHALIRKHADSKPRVRLRNKWTEIDPTSWGERSDMSIEVGMGAAGKEIELANIEKQLQLTQSIIQMQGGPSGPFVTPQNVYNLVKKFYEKSGEKAPEQFITDPQTAQPQEPQPDPKMIEAQQKLQLEQQKLQADVQMQQQKLEAEIQLKREQMMAEMQLKREQMAIEAQMQVTTANINAATNTNMQPVRMGGEVG